MESFWNFLQLESAAGRGSRPSAAREGGAEPRDPRPRRRRSGGGGDLPARSRTSPGARREAPLPRRSSGAGGGPGPPFPAWAADRGQVQAAPLPQPPGFPLGPSPRREAGALRPPGEGAGAQAQPPGRPGSSRGGSSGGGGGGKTRERIPSAARPAPPAGVEASEGGEAVLSQPPPPPCKLRASGRRTAGETLDHFPNSGSGVLLGATLHLAGQGVQERDPGGRASLFPEP